MRNNAAAVRPRSGRPTFGRQALELRVVEGVDRGPKRAAAGFLFTCALLLSFAIIIPLIANTNMAKIAYDMRDISVELREERARSSSLEAELLVASSPQALRERAKQVGMVPAGPIGVIVLETGTVEGGLAAQ